MISFIIGFIVGFALLNKPCQKMAKNLWRYLNNDK